MPITPRVKKDDRWNTLADKYRSHGLVLVLGAGLCAGSNLPTWNELLYRVADACWTKNGRDKIKALEATGMALPAVASVLETQCNKLKKDFPRELRDALYLNFPFKNKPSNTKLLAEHYRDVARHVLGLLPGSNRNDTMATVAAMCVEPDATAKGGFAANPHIHSLVTSNVDVLLRTYIRAQYGEWLLGTVEHARRSRRLGKIPAYYMHGYIRYYDRGPDEEDEPEPLVFTEEEYYDFFNRPNSVFHYTMLYLLREYNCLFIGMSMQDPNFRRLLHYSTIERRPGKDRSNIRMGLRHFAILSRPKTRDLEELSDLSLRRIGVRALWIDGFDEIPDRLSAVYGSDWSKVFPAIAQGQPGADQKAS